ncbi:hypothetical protein ACOSQ2_022549 [Xanthoceras sorbifolium]
MDHNPGPNKIKPKLRKWKKIVRSPSQCVVFSPSSPIQKLLTNKRRTRNGSKSPVTKSSPLKVIDDNSSDMELGDGGKRRG